MKKLLLIVSAILLVSVFINNPVSAQTDVAAGPISGTWTLANSPYYIQGEITIPNDSTLTIEPGVRVEFQGHYKFNVQGRLMTAGTETDLITFTVSDTTGFSNNAASDGVWGGIRFDVTPVTNDSSLLKYCVIEYAKTFAGNAGGMNGEKGGGIFIGNFSKLRVEHCIIQHNRVICDVFQTYPIGGGIAITNYASPVIVNNIIQYNRSVNLISSYGGTGGGIGVFGNSSPLISGNTIRFNRAPETGGGLGIWIDSYPLVTNNLIVENVCQHNNGTGGYGGGVSIGFDARPKFINNTIVNNSAGRGGGFWFNEADAIFINTIIADNQDTDNPDAAGSQIRTYNMSGYTFDFHNSCLKGGETDIEWFGNGAATVNFVASIAVDPGLQSNYELEDTSPCIGIGTMSCEISSTTYNAPSYDLAGNDRPMPAGTLPDMGAFEDQYINVSISDEMIMPAKFALSQNYPNPFNPTTHLRYDLPEQAFVQLAIYDLLGRQVTTLINRVENAGYRSVTWNGTDAMGKTVSAGMYLYVIKAGDFVQTRKMILLK